VRHHVRVHQVSYCRGSCTSSRTRRNSCFATTCE
jgi:hypothetical protein